MGHVGLVLAGGGITGMAFHAGALAALEEVTGWDPRQADLIIGTSAGSIAGAILRLGVSTSDQVARATGDEPSNDARALFAGVGPAQPIELPDFDARRRPPVDPQALARILRSRGKQRRAAILAAMPAGTVDTSPLRQGFASLFPTFPDGLWITAVRASDGALVVFGRDRTDVSVADALAASSAIPGFFTPVEIDGATYVDGGLRSMANADLARDLGLDLVIVSSPMTFQPIAPGPLGEALSTPLHARLRAELRRIRADGTPVLLLEPDTTLRRQMGANAMDASRRPEITLASRAGVRATLERLDLAKFTRHL